MALPTPIHTPEVHPTMNANRPLCPICRRVMRAERGESGVWRCPVKPEHELHMPKDAGPLPQGEVPRRLAYEVTAGLPCPCGGAMQPIPGTHTVWRCLANPEHEFLDGSTRQRNTYTAQSVRFEQAAVFNATSRHWLYKELGVHMALGYPPQSNARADYSIMNGPPAPGGGGSKSGGRKRKKPKKLKQDLWGC